MKRAAKSLDKRLGERVRSRRLEIGVSQEKLAETLGITFQQVQKYEKGQNRISASRLVAIATVLQLPVATFFEGIPGQAKDAAESDLTRAMATPEVTELLKLFASIKSLKVRRRAVNLVNALVEETLSALKKS